MTKDDYVGVMLGTLSFFVWVTIALCLDDHRPHAVVWMTTPHTEAAVR
jgi:hypothetical protein